MESKNTPQTPDPKSEYYESSNKNKRNIILAILGSLFLISLLFSSVRSFYGTMAKTVGESIYRQKFLWQDINSTNCAPYMNYFGERRFSDCYDCCLQLVDCEEAKKTGTREALFAYLDKYEENKDSCWNEVKAMLDSLDCNSILLAEDKMQAHINYLAEYGDDGACSEQVRAALSECDTLLKQTDCQPYLDYISEKGLDAVCADSAMVFLFDNNCGVADQTICDWLKKQSSCEVILKNFGRLSPDSECYNQLKTILEEQCQYAEDEIAYYAALSNKDRIAALKNFVDSYGDSSFRGAAEDELVARGGSRPNSFDNRSPRSPTADCGSFGGVRAVKLGQLWVMQKNLSSPTAARVSAEHEKDFGSLFTWKEAHDACPSGWRLPCEQEIKYLQEIYGDPFTTLASNERCRFNAPMSGYVDGRTDRLKGVGSEAAFWCATEQSDKKGYAYVFDANFSTFTLTWLDKNSRLSCRCVKEYDPRKTSSAFLKLADCPNWPGR